MKILAIESSCDETSASVLEKVKGQIKVLSNVTATSLKMHAATGGIIPENAARMQVKFIMPVVIDALMKSSKGHKFQTNTAHDGKLAVEILKKEIDSIAVTFGPGLIGSLLVGVETAKTLSYAFNKSIIPVNHLLAHVYANYIDRQEEEIQFPFIGLIVSGGHTDLLYFASHNKYAWLGGTRDDAAGEALDKIGRLLNLSYPAGPEIERRANLLSKASIKFKSPIINEENFDFSFSGLKTEAMRFIEKNTLTEELINQICSATQKAIFDVLIKKTLNAAGIHSTKTILIGGGVSANETFRNEIERKAQEMGIKTLFPNKKYSTDNGAMIGAYALNNFVVSDWKKVSANPNLYFS